MDFSILRDDSDSAFSTDVLSAAITAGVSIAGSTLTSGVEIISAPQLLSTTSTVMTHEEHNITFIPGGPAGTVAINETHHITSTGDVIESLNSTHHIGSDGLLTSNAEANLTREFHGLTDEHLDNHTAAGSTHDMVHLFHPTLADSGWLEMGEPETPARCNARQVVQAMVDREFDPASFHSGRARDLEQELQRCRDVLAGSPSLSRRSVEVKPSCSRTAACDFKELLESNSLENLRACADVMQVLANGSCGGGP